MDNKIICCNAAEIEGTVEFGESNVS